MRTVALLLAMIASSASGAEPGITVVPKPTQPKWTELKIQPGVQLLLTVGSDKDKWFLLDANCELTAIPNSPIAVFTATQPGRYRAVAVSGETVLPVIVVVGDAPDVDPKPNPPKPPEPKPVDPLKAKVKVAFDADATQLDKRREQAADLAALYRKAAELAGDSEIASSGELLRRVREASMTLVGADALKSVRRIVGEELSGILPTDTQLVAEQRDAAAKLFVRFAVILEELAK